MSTCLSCFEELGQGTYHESCCRNLFTSPIPPTCDLRLESLPNWAMQELGAHHALTGAQRKISAHWHPGKTPYGQPRRLTVVGALGGRFIVKPTTPEFPGMPANEALTMALARHFGITTAHSGLIELADGTLAYITQRYDRTARLGKIHCEDMAQLTGTMTEDKYRGSIEQIGDVIRKHSSQPGVDLAHLFSRTVFSWLTGNSDMHLKNFSMLMKEDRAILSPAYDLLAAQLHLPDDEDSALTLNGKRKRLRKSDFIALARHLGISSKYQQATWQRIPGWWSRCRPLLDSEWIPKELGQAYASLVEERIKAL